jgi:hypothetical protein
MLTYTSKYNNLYITLLRKNILAIDERENKPFVEVLKKRKMVSKIKVYEGTINLVGRCKLWWLTFCDLMDFLQNVLYSNATNAL